MTNEMRRKNLSHPTGTVDVVLDTDAYNEIDDQFAIAYLLKSKDRLNTKAIYAAPFHKPNNKDDRRTKNPGEGMEKSYDEIMKLLSLMGECVDVYRGSEEFLRDEKTPVISPAARDLAERANAYSPERSLYVVAIGAITNVASAILLNSKVAENTVVVWLGGHALHYRDTAEFNMRQDVAAARVVMGSGVPFVQLPCGGVVSSFTISKPELEYWFKGKSPLATYLAESTIAVADGYAQGKPWTRCIWDVTAVAWLLSENERFMFSRIEEIRLPGYDNRYEETSIGIPMEYVYYIRRDSLWEDVITKLTH